METRGPGRPPLNLTPEERRARRREQQLASNKRVKQRLLEKILIEILREEMENNPELQAKISKEAITTFAKIVAKSPYVKAHKAQPIITKLAGTKGGRLSRRAKV